VSGQAVAGVYTGLSPDVLTVFILACPQACWQFYSGLSPSLRKPWVCSGGWGTHNNPSLNTFFLKVLCLNANFCVFRLAHPQAKIGRSYRYANVLCKHLNVNHSMQVQSSTSKAFWQCYLAVWKSNIDFYKNTWSWSEGSYCTMVLFF
jgi:hypothetical protein